MRRKLIQHGMSSLTVSMPKKWVNKNNLVKGGEVEIEIFNNRLIISTEKQYKHNKISLDISNAQPMIRKIVGATYKAGFDEVHIRFNTYQELKAIQDVVREQFTGFEIIGQSKESIIIKNLTQTNFEEFNNVLRRFFFVLNHISTEFCSAVEKDDFVWVKNTALIKIESDKFADYCRRAINMGFESEFERIAPLYTIIEQLEKVVDRYKDLCEYVSDNKLILNKDIKSYSKDLLKFQEYFYNLFYKFELENIIILGKDKEVLQRKIDKIADCCSKKEVKVIMLFDRILNLIFDLNGPLMTIVINKASKISKTN